MLHASSLLVCNRRSQYAAVSPDSTVWASFRLSFVFLYYLRVFFFFFFFSSRRRHTRFDCDWSSDVCSSDLVHSIWRAPPSLTPASELATAMPRSLWQCTLQTALSLLGTRSRRFLMKAP